MTPTANPEPNMTRIENAIAESVTYNTRAVVRGATVEEIEDALVLSDDHVTENDGSIDVWGTTAAGDPWRLCVAPAC